MKESRTSMNAQTQRQHPFGWGVVPVAAAAVTLILYTGCTESGDYTPPTQSGNLSAPLRERHIARVPSFRLTERSGQEITLADLQGQVWIVDFIFTRCVDACPLMTATMARLQSELGNEANLRLVSITVDPEYDKPGILTEYATQFGASPDRWYFLTGDKNAIYRLVQDGFKLAIHDPEDSQASRGLRRHVVQTLRRWVDPESAWAHGGHEHRQPVIHSNRFVLVDGDGWIRGYYHGTDRQMVTQLIQDARNLLHAGQ
jgi:protein SCO1/2